MNNSTQNRFGNPSEFSNIKFNNLIKYNFISPYIFSNLYYNRCCCLNYTYDISFLLKIDMNMCLKFKRDTYFKRQKEVCDEEHF